jgi:hypothetical protein
MNEKLELLLFKKSKGTLSIEEQKELDILESTSQMKGIPYQILKESGYTMGNKGFLTLLPELRNMNVGSKAQITRISNVGLAVSKANEIHFSPEMLSELKQNPFGDIALMISKDLKLRSYTYEILEYSYAGKTFKYLLCNDLVEHDKIAVEIERLKDTDKGSQFSLKAL